MKNTVCEAAGAEPAWRMEQALIAMDGNPELLVRVARLLLKQLDADLPLIQRYVQEQDSLPLKDRSHRLKGSLSAIAATPAFEACAALNALAASAQASAYAAGWERLACEVARLRPHLNQFVSNQEA